MFLKSRLEALKIFLPAARYRYIKSIHLTNENDWYTSKRLSALDNKTQLKSLFKTALHEFNWKGRFLRNSAVRNLNGWKAGGEKGKTHLKSFICLVLCACVFLVCVCASCMHMQKPAEVRSVKSPGVGGTEGYMDKPIAFSSAVSAFNHWTIFPSPKSNYC